MPPKLDRSRILAERRRLLSENKQRVLEKRLRGASCKVSESPFLKRPAGILPSLSFAQERLWFLQQLAPESTTYNEFASYRISGKLDLTILDNALRTLAERHEILRVSFRNERGKPVLDFADLRNVSLVESHDLTSLDATTRESRLAQITLKEVRQTFDLSLFPLFRFTVIQCDVSEFVALFTVHHIIMDGWSMALLIEELANIYTRFVNGQTIDLPASSLQYSDYAWWQRGQVSTGAFSRQLDFWKQELAGTPTLELPTDHPHPKISTGLGFRQPVVISKETTERLREIGLSQGATLFMTLLAALIVLLNRYTSQDDIAIGVPTAGRSRPDFEPLLGCFVNTLVIRTKLDDNPEFLEVLRRVRKASLSAYDNQDIPFGKVVEEIQPERNLGRMPLFQVMFALQNFPKCDGKFAGLTMTQIETDTGTAKCDLFLSLNEEQQGQLCGTLECNADIFERTTARRYVTHFENVIRAIVSSPSSRVSELSILSNKERSLINGWSTGASAPLPPKRVHELIEQWVAHVPDAVAVQDSWSELTYRELNTKANHLALKLRLLGVQVGMPVLVYMDRCVDMLVTLIAILRAGGVYVALEPSIPLKRIEFILADTGSRWLISKRSNVPAISQSSAAEVICIEDMPNINFSGAHASPRRVSENDPAYITYTSGSTGKPKGVIVTHLALSNVLDAFQQILDFNQLRVMLAVTTVSFDISALELFLPLIVGAKVVISSSETARDPKALAVEIDQCSASVMQATPVTWQMLINSGWQGRQDFTILVGGEALDRSLANALCSYGATVWNLYGPSETTIWSLAYQVSPEGGVVPIGKPIQNTQAFVLNRELDLVPIGVQGELYLGGFGLAEGYVGLPELTEERFIASPFETGRKLYRTGDQARYLSNGQIEFLGRLDDQVKVRGFRIELGEIEAVIRDFGSIDQVVVTATGMGTDKKTLTAYIVPEEDLTLLEFDLREFLKQRLPSYMVPSMFVTVSSLPLTQNGKVDRRSLPVPQTTIPKTVVRAESHPDELQQVMALIWADVLGRGDAKANDNFFALGGHSLLAVQTISRIREAFGVSLPVAAIFESPTLNELTARVRAQLRVRSGKFPIKIIPGLQDEVAPLTYGQETLWRIENVTPKAPFNNLSYAIRIEGELEAIQLERSFEAIVHRHAILRTRIEVSNRNAVQVVNPQVSFRLIDADLSHLPLLHALEGARQLAAQFSQIPFDLERAPLLRALLLKLGSADYILVVAAHHLVVDGWSLELLNQELVAQYKALQTNTPVSLPELHLQYADFSRWQRNPAREREWTSQVEYWRNRLLVTEDTVNLPTDRVPAGPRSFQYGWIERPINSQRLKALQETARRQRASLFMVLLTAWVYVLREYASGDTITVGTLTANRGIPETEDLIGLFINTVPLRIPITGQEQFIVQLDRVRRVALEAYAHHDVPFEYVLEHLQSEKAFGQKAMFETLFIHQSFAFEHVQAQGFRTSKFQFRNKEGIEILISTFKLILEVQDEEAGLSIVLKFDSDLFTQNRAELILQQFDRWLSQAQDTGAP